MDSTGRFFDSDLDPNAQLGIKLAEWYINTDENETDDEGNLTLDARLKRTVNAALYSLEFTGGLGVGLGHGLKAFEFGGGLLCHYDILAVQYCDGEWNAGERIEFSAVISFTQAFEFGGIFDGFMQYGRRVMEDPTYWLGFNNKKDSWTLFDFDCYDFFLGGNLSVGFDLNTFLSDLSEIWGYYS